MFAFINTDNTGPILCNNSSNTSTSFQTTDRRCTDRNNSNVRAGVCGRSCALLHNPRALLIETGKVGNGAGGSLSMARAIISIILSEICACIAVPRKSVCGYFDARCGRRVAIDNINSTARACERAAVIVIRIGYTIDKLFI